MALLRLLLLLLLLGVLLLQQLLGGLARGGVGCRAPTAALHVRAVVADSRGECKAVARLQAQLYASAISLRQQNQRQAILHNQSCSLVPGTEH